MVRFALLVTDLAVRKINYWVGIGTSERCGYNLWFAFVNLAARAGGAGI